MEFFYQDKGKYLRGLLILIGKDNIIDPDEKKRLHEVGKRLDFDPRFIDEALDEFLENEYIDKNPPKFSSRLVAKSFLEDAINMVLIDSDIHVEELEWIKSVAKTNEIDDEWLEARLVKYVNNGTMLKKEINEVD